MRIEERETAPVVFQSPERGQRRNNFDFLRLFLAGVVVFSHSFDLGGAWPEPLRVITRGQTSAGTAAVWCFFAISGYLIAASFFNSKNAREYLGKRIRRIYPAFIACLVFEAIVIAPLSGGVLLAPGMLNVVVCSLFLSNVAIVKAFAHNPFPREVNGSLWTIRYEFGCYLAILVMGVTGLLKRRRWVAVAFTMAIVIRVAGSVLQTPSYKFSWNAPQLAAMYLAGVIAFLYRDRIRYTNRRCVLCVVLLAAGCFIPHGLSAIFPLAGGYVLFWIAFMPVGSRFNVCRYGDLSYGFYLYAFPVQQVIVAFWGRPMNPLLLFCISAPVALVLARGSWLFVESRFLKRRALNGAPGREATIAEIAPSSRWTATTLATAKQR